MMDCKHIDELLVEYLYQELDPSQVEQFEAHLQSCPRCAGELASYERTRAIVQEMPEVEPPSRVDERLLAEASRAVNARPAAEGREPSFWQRISEGLRLLVMHPAMTAAVTLVLVLGVSFYVYRSSSPRSAREQPDAPYAPEVDRRLPSGSATISVRERTAEPEGEARKEEQATQQAPAPAATQDPQALKGVERVVAKRTPGRRSKEVLANERGGRGLMPETANVFGKAGASGGSAGSLSTSNAPVAEPQKEPQKDLLPKLAKAPNADEAQTRASKARDRESVDKNAGFGQKKISVDSLDGALIGKGGGKQGAGTSGGVARRATKAETKVAAAPRREPRATPAAAKPVAPKPAPIAQQGRLAKGKGKGWSGKPGNAADDLDSLGDEGKAAYKGQLAAKFKSSAGESGAAWAALGDKARVAGRCDQALAYYNRAVSLDGKLLGALAGKVRACAMELAKASDLPLLKATKSYPALAGLLAPELERARRSRAAAAETQNVRGPRKAKARPAAKHAAPAKADKADAYESAK